MATVTGGHSNHKRNIGGQAEDFLCRLRANMLMYKRFNEKHKDLRILILKSNLYEKSFQPGTLHDKGILDVARAL